VLFAAGGAAGVEVAAGAGSLFSTFFALLPPQPIYIYLVAQYNPRISVRKPQIQKMTMEVYLTRHGQTYGNVQRILQGQ
jgi:hypothetical protein